jgi:hypothetical protein
MVNKKGLSTVVTTIVIILIVLISIGIVWGIINNVLTKGKKDVRIEQFTNTMGISSTVFDYDNEEINIRIKRNEGDEEVSELLIIIEDDVGTEVFEQEVQDFNQFEEKIFNINLTDTPIDMSQIKSISVVPIFIINGEKVQGASPSGNAKLDFNRNYHIENGGTEDTSGEGTGGEDDGFCSQDSDCGSETIVEDSAFCKEGANAVYQFKKTPSCAPGNWCVNATTEVLLQSCTSEEICLDGECMLNPTSCIDTPENISLTCGENDWIGEEFCSSSTEEVLQQFTTYYCIAGACSSGTDTLVHTACTSGQICQDAQCLTPQECASDSDCVPLYGAGYLCNSTGECEQEFALSMGIVGSIWPFNLGEYFESDDLPNIENSTNDLVGNFISFPLPSLEENCFLIIEHVFPANPNDNSYVRLNSQETEISVGDPFEIWETAYCGGASSS